MKAILTAIIFVVTSVLIPNDKLTGRWESKPSEKGNVTGVVFKEGRKMEGYVNRKPFVSGDYFFSTADSILSFIDNGCGQSMAVYKVNFFSNSDSLRFTSIYDTCTERKNGMHRLRMGRVHITHN